MKPIRKAPLRREHGSDRPAPVTLREEGPTHRTNAEAQSHNKPIYNDAFEIMNQIDSMNKLRPTRFEDTPKDALRPHHTMTQKDATATTPKTHGPVAQVTPYHKYRRPRHYAPAVPLAIASSVGAPGAK